jgi:hypothetical protein
VLGLFIVCLLFTCVEHDEKMLKGVKHVFSASSSNRRFASLSQESMSQDSARPSSFMPPQHGATQSSYNPAQAEVPTKDDVNIFI